MRQRLVRIIRGRPQEAQTTGHAHVSVERWLAACAKGDHRAFENLYRFTAPKLYGLAVRILKNDSLAQECVQDAYVSIWHHAQEYRPERAAPLTWMVSILRHRAIDLLRQRGHEITLDEPDDLKILLNADAEPEDGMAPQDVRALHACIGQLREEQRRCLQLAYFDNLSHAQMAVRLHVPLGTVKTWVRRALEQLRRCLG